MKTVKICRVSDVGRGEVKRFATMEVDVAVYNLDGRFYVTDDTCTHGPSSLADGFIEGDTIECPFHYGTFHIPTGKPLKAPCVVAIRVYPTSIVGDDLFIEVD